MEEELCVLKEEIRKLIDESEQVLHDRKIPAPVEMTTREQYRLEGYDAARRNYISRLKDILYFSKVEPTLKDKLSYTE